MSLLYRDIYQQLMIFLFIKDKSFINGFVTLVFHVDNMQIVGRDKNTIHGGERRRYGLQF